MRKNLTTDDLASLLDQPRLAVLATHYADGTTLLSPVWHEWRDGGFTILVGSNDVKARQMRRDPRVSVVLADDLPPYAGIEVRGQAELRPHVQIGGLLQTHLVAPLTVREGIAAHEVQRVAGGQLRLAQRAELVRRGMQFELGGADAVHTGGLSWVHMNGKRMLPVKLGPFLSLLKGRGLLAPNR